MVLCSRDPINNTFRSTRRLDHYNETFPKKMEEITAHSNESILIVDDKPENIQLLREMLKQEGFKVRVAPNGNRALESIKLEPPDLILLDILMPGINGYEVCRKLKQSVGTSNIPVIFISALGEVKDKIESFAVGGADHIIKPFEAEEVLVRINSQLTICKLRQHLEEKNKQLQAYQNSLEEKLDERTAEIVSMNQSLSSVNRELKAEIAERKRVEDALRESEQRFRSIFDHTTVGLCLTEPLGDIVVANRALHQILAIQDGGLTGKQLTDFVKSVDLPVFKRTCGNESGKESDLNLSEIRFDTTEGREVVCLVGNIVTRDASEVPVYQITHVQEISQIKNLQNQLRHAQKLEAVGTLAGGIAHDFNGLISLIMGWADIVRNHHLTEEHPATHGIYQIIKTSERAKDLVKQILTFSRKREQDQKIISIYSLAREIGKLLESTLMSQVDFSIRSKAKEDRILADPNLIYQVIMNLGTNAAYSMGEAGGKFEILLDDFSLGQDDQANYPNLNPGKYLQMRITDTGKGIPEGNLERIFEPYFTTKPIDQGTGLGLSIVHGIIEDLNGAIYVDSTSGIGTSFTILLPLVTDISSEFFDNEFSSFPTGTERILLLDDELKEAELYQTILTKQGYQVDIKTDPLSVLNTLGSSPEKYDLLLTDFVLPAMMGDKLANEVKRINRNLPIVVSTGLDESLVQERLNSIDVAAVIQKPITINNLATTIREVLDSSKKDETHD